jgi:hypothetical protein
MSAMTARDKWLAAALPALLTLLIGWFFFLRPASREIAALRQRVENQGPLSTRQALAKAAQAECAELEKSVAEKRRAPAAEDGVFDRNWAMQQVSLLCAAHSLSLNSTAPEQNGKLPPELQEASAAMTGNATLPQVWRIELSGPYPGMVKLLDGLQRAKPLIIPLNLSMETGKNERQPAKWVLTLWL